ncbi:MAG: thiol-activated cytolysin family protein [Bacteroidota bacterium]
MLSFRFIPIFVLVLMSIFGCEHDSFEEMDTPMPSPQSKTFDQIIAQGGQFESFAEKSDSTIVDSTLSDQHGEEWLCVSKEYDFVNGAEEYFNFNPSSEIIWPGNLLQGNSITESTPNPIVIDRGPGCVTIDLVNGSTGTQKCVDKVSQGNIIEALNEIIDANNGILPAQFSYNFEEIQSQQQMAFKMGVNFHSLTTDVKGKLSINSNRSYHSYLVTLTQNFYTMIFEKPTSYDAFFAAEVQPSDLEPYIGPGNPGTYISSVTYGRKFYLLVESTSSRTDIRASIKATYDAAVVGGSLSASAQYVKDLENSSIKVFALGGDQGLALSTFNGDMTAVGRYLTEGGDYRTGVPLSYVLRSLETHQDLAVKVATKYQTTVCEPKIFDDTPPPFTAFWSDAFDAIGSATQLQNGDIALFDLTGKQYVICDQFNYTFTGPYSIHDESAPLKNCPLDAVSAAQLLPSGNLYLHDGTGTKYTVFRPDSSYSSIYSLSVWGHDDHPFDLHGISAAIEDNSSRVIHFNKTGDKYGYYSINKPFGNVYDLWQWGPDNTCPINAVGAAVKLELANSYYILFDLSGTTYTIYQAGNGGQFIGYYQL